MDINIYARKKCIKALKRPWDELRYDLYNGIIQYNDINIIKKYTFMKQFNSMFTTEKSRLEVSIKELKYISRVVSVETDSYQRFIPCKSSLNRMNPPGEIFLYLSVSYDDLSKASINFADMTCIEEIGKTPDCKISLCRFEICSEYIDNKIINISIANSFKEEEIVNRIILASKKTSINCMGVAKELTNLYFHLISSELFLPVVSDNYDVKKYEYAPFHAFADYFRKNGYIGLIYKSTKHIGGKNLVLFDLKYATYVKEPIKYV